jgi:2-oxo-4-hydroxy-4-carboxy-5-ureidoimidazoline decarboxylase
MSTVPALHIGQFNNLTQAEFMARLGSVYEHSPWVAEGAWPQHPFASVDVLSQAMQDVVLSSGAERQLGLIRAHPELLGKLAAAELTAESRGEQASAGLDRCTAAERSQLQALNQAYRERFGFPFVVAVRGLNWGDIIARISTRLKNERQPEMKVALEEIGRIARFRLADIVSG